MLAACGGDDHAAKPDAAIAIDAATPTCLPAATYPLQIAHGAFAAIGEHPNVIVQVPDGFEPTARIDVVVHIHGFSNCITNALGDTDTPCTDGGAARSAYQLATQLAVSGANALLILPEVQYDLASGDPGALGTTDGFAMLLDDTLAAIPPPLGPLDRARIGNVIVTTHSGGYTAASAMVTIGGVPANELWLFDSLYGEETRFDAYVKSDLASLIAPTRRFANIYTDGGGTLANSQAMATRAAGWVDPAVLIDDRTTATWDDPTYDHGLLFKHSALTHDGVPRYYFEHLLATSPTLRPRRCPVD